MRDIMFDLPSEKDVEKVIVTKEVITDNKPVEIVRKNHENS